MYVDQQLSRASVLHLLTEKRKCVEGLSHSWVRKALQVLTFQEDVFYRSPPISFSQEVVHSRHGSDQSLLSPLVSMIE